MSPDEQRDAIVQIRSALEGRKPPVQVLVIEDDIADAEATVARMQASGINATWVRNTKETQDYLREHDPWLIFLDMKLGPVSGLNVLDFIKMLKPGCRVVVLTGAYHHDSQECKEALKKGAIAVMLKPLTQAQIQLIFSAP